MPTLADIYSGIDTAKRKAGNFIRQPLSTLQEMIALGNDQARLANQQTALSAQGARREMRGQPMTQEQALADQELQQRLMEQMNIGGMTVKNPNAYRGSHLAPGPDFGAPLHDLTGGGQMYPSDVYSASATRIYGTGYPQADKEAFALAKQVRGNPDAQVTMYRAVPKDDNIKEINKGDWVSLSKDYAKNHGEAVLKGDYKIISKKVKAKNLWTNADSIHEFGYHPE
jgi:hypothetical protein